MIIFCLNSSNLKVRKIDRVAQNFLKIDWILKNFSNFENFQNRVSEKLAKSKKFSG